MRRKIPASHSLLCFDATARHRSLTRAAVELSLTQSAVSRQILALEEYLGVTLFKRTRHGMELTAVGADYAARVAQRLGALEQDTQDIMGAGVPGGLVRGIQAGRGSRQCRLGSRRGRRVGAAGRRGGVGGQ